MASRTVSSVLINRVPGGVVAHLCGSSVFASLTRKTRQLKWTRNWRRTVSIV